MNKENKWLLIFTGIFLVIGIVSTLLIGSYVDYRETEKELSKYREVLPTVSSFKEDGDFLKTDHVVKKENYYDKNKNIIGYGYTAEIVSLNTIPLTEEAKLVLKVIIDKNDKVVLIETIESGHTPDYYEVYETPFGSVNMDLDKGKIDTIAGSTISAGIINELLGAVKAAHLGEPDLTAYEVIFGEGSVGAVIDDFTGNEIVVEKASVNDEEGNLIGYTYTGTITLIDVIPYKASAELTIMIGVNLEGKVEGIAHVVNVHTAGYYNNYLEALENLSGVEVENLEISKVAGSTISYDVLTEIFNAVKEVILNE